MEQFVSGSIELELRCTNRDEAYGFIAQILKQYRYTGLKRANKGIVRAFIAQVTGYSSANITILIKRFISCRELKAAKRTQPVFEPRFTREDIVELARIDEIHQNLSGPSMVVILKREYEVFGNQSCIRLSGISSSHLYNLRSTKTYNNIRVYYQKTKPSVVAIGKRVKPLTDGKPGHIRVDTVHQGDKDGDKGVYHVNLVDEITQMEVIVAVEGISERYMIPALDLAVRMFPFVIIGFHSDNGSEYINKIVADLLNRLKIEQTKSRPRHSGDNGLVESKNGSIIRKNLGYTHIPRTADNVVAINKWYMNWFIPYINYHRPCAFRETKITDKGKQIHTYPKNGYMTPYEKLKSIDKDKVQLRPELSFELLDIQAYAMSDTNWAQHMQIAKESMWKSITF
jgi:transposase InsO family protein